MNFLYITRNNLLAFRILKRKKRGWSVVEVKKFSVFRQYIFITGITIKLEFSNFPEEETNDNLAK